MRVAIHIVKDRRRLNKITFSILTFFISKKIYKETTKNNNAMAFKTPTTGLF